MRRRLFCSLMGIAASAGLAQTLPAPTTQELIHSLGVDDWKQRQAAQDALVELGQAAVPALTATTQAAVDEETRSRALSALTAIDEARVAGPSRITLHLHDVDPQQAFAELARQAQAPLEPIAPQLWHDVAQTRVSIDLDHASFWSAVQSLGEQTRIWPQQWNNGYRLIQGGPLVQGPRCASGPLLIVAQSIEHNQSISLSSDHRTDALVLHAFVMAEPKLHLVRASMTFDMTEATDDANHSLLPTDAAQRGGRGFSAGSAWWNCVALLSMPRGSSATRIHSLAGSVSLQVASQLQAINLPTVPGNRASLTSDAGTLTLREARELPDHRLQYTFDIAGSATDNAEMSWPQQLSRGGVLNLCDAAGHVFRREGMEIGGDRLNTHVVLRFARQPMDNNFPVGEPDHFSGDLVVAARDLSVPFTFTDLPLP